MFVLISSYYLDRNDYLRIKELLIMEKMKKTQAGKADLNINHPLANSNMGVSVCDTKTVLQIEQRIFVIREVQVMIDRDLAELFGVETKVLNQAVKRNINRFPERFMFQLSEEECSRSQFVTMNGGRGYNIKYLPYAFTEQGVAMLSAVLRSDSAVEVSIRVMDAFVRMRHFMVANAQIFQRLERLDRKQLVLCNI